MRCPSQQPQQHARLRPLHVIRSTPLMPTPTPAPTPRAGGSPVTARLHTAARSRVEHRSGPCQSGTPAVTGPHLPTGSCCWCPCSWAAPVSPARTHRHMLHQRPSAQHLRGERTAPTKPPHPPISLRQQCPRICRSGALAVNNRIPRCLTGHRRVTIATA